MLIDYYKAIESSSTRMLEAARTQDWDSVLRMEGACTVLIEQLRFHARMETLSESERHEKTQIMLRILKNDAEVRNLAEPWLEHIEHRMEHKPLLH